MKSVPLTAAVRPRPVESADLLRGHRGDKPPMVTLATLSRGLGVVALSGCAVVALAVARGPEPQPAAPPPVPKPAAAAPAPAAPAAPDVRLVYGSPDAPRGYDRAAAAPSEPVAEPAAPPVAANPLPVAPPAASIPAPPPVAAVAEPPLAPAASAPFALASAGPVGLPEDAQPLVEAAAAAGDAVDLNTASAEQLNRLDAGMIGRAIVRGRPYASPKELVERRILSRASFDKIKARVVVGAAR